MPTKFLSLYPPVSANIICESSLSDFNPLSYTLATKDILLLYSFLKAKRGQNTLCQDFTGLTLSSKALLTMSQRFDDCSKTASMPHSCSLFPDFFQYEYHSYCVNSSCTKMLYIYWYFPVSSVPWELKIYLVRSTHIFSGGHP